MSGSVKINGHHDVKEELKPLYFSESNCPEQDGKLLEPYSHIVRLSGKNIRQKLIQGFNMWMKVDGEKISAIEEIINMLHNASLLLDDIEDNSRYIYKYNICTYYCDILNVNTVVYFKVTARPALRPPDIRDP